MYCPSSNVSHRVLIVQDPTDDKYFTGGGNTTLDVPLCLSKTLSKPMQDAEQNAENTETAIRAMGTGELISENIEHRDTCNYGIPMKIRQYSAFSCTVSKQYRRQKLCCNLKLDAAIVLHFEMAYNISSPDVARF